MKPNKLSLTERVKVNKFVNKILNRENKPGSDSQLRGDTENRRQDWMIGIVAEFGFRNIFNQLNDYDIGDPNLIINETGQNTFDPDFIDGDIRYHIKSCNMENINNSDFNSWTARKDDPIINNPDENDYIVFMYSNKDGEYEYLTCIKASDITTLWRNCISSKMKHKLAIYYKELKIFKEEKLDKNFDEIFDKG